MSSFLNGVSSQSFFLTKSVRENTTSLDNVSVDFPTAATSGPFQNDCVNINEMEFLPWDNPDNIISVENEMLTGQVKDNLLVLLFLIGGPANVINMLVFHKLGLKDRVNLCLFALSFTDGLTLLSATWHYGEQFYIQFTTKVRFGPVATALSDNNLYVISGFCYISYVLSAIIAMERCLCVYKPLKFQSLLSTKTMIAVIIVVYILVIGLFSIVVFKYRVGCAYDPVSGETIITSAEKAPFYKAHKTFIDLLESFLFGLGLPGVIMIMVTTTTTMTIVKLRQAVRWRSESSSISARELAVTKILVANSIFFITCLFPIAVYRFTWLFFPEIKISRRNQNFFQTTVSITEMLTYINATFNIFIYYSMGSRYRETFWALCGRTLHSKQKQ